MPIKRVGKKASLNNDLTPVETDLSSEPTGLLTERYVPSIEKLAGILDRSSTIMREYQARAGFPKRTSQGYDVAACATWLAQNVKQHGNASALTTERKNTEELKQDKLKEEIELLRKKNGVQDRRLIDREKLNEAILHTGTLLKQSLYDALGGSTCVELEGKNAGEIRQILAAKADHILAKWHGLDADIEKLLDESTST